jgi:hypothetical protein
MSNETITQNENANQIEDLTLDDTSTAGVKGGAAYMKLGDIKGEVATTDHKEWINLESMSVPISR